jgi:Zn-dependent peptidase ImmA (M78 family)
VSAIETGERLGQRLLRAVEFLVCLDYFTDPFLLAGEGCFSWRQAAPGLRRLRTTKPMLAPDRRLPAGPQVGRGAPLLRHALGLNKQSQLEEAAAAGERFAAEFKLGDVPAARLAEVMERELGLLVLMIDPIKGVSGAACRLPDLDVVLINRREIAGRRHFDLAHELFHILTWDAMPPEHIEEVTPKTRTRVVQLADNFASAVLMPATVIDRFGDWKTLEDDQLIGRLNATADELLVSASALRWRLVSLGRLDKAVGSHIPENKLRHNGRPKQPEEALPPLFSKSFIEVIGRAIDQGRVAVRRVSYLLGLSIDAWLTSSRPMASKRLSRCEASWPDIAELCLSTPT